MRTETTYIGDLFSEIVANIRAEFDPDNLLQPYYMYGRRNEIMQLLLEKDESDVYKFQKYPLIILYHGQPEQHQKEWEYTVSPLISIVTESDRTFRTGDRYTETLKPILYPLYNLLIAEMADNPAIYQSYPQEIQHELKVWDGSPAENKTIGILFNDYLDGIDLKFRDIQMFKNSPICPGVIINPVNEKIFMDDDAAIFIDGDIHLFT